MDKKPGVDKGAQLWFIGVACFMLVMICAGALWVWG